MVDITDKTGTGSQTANDAVRERVFQDILQQSEQHLLVQLRALLESADELFFDLSSRATSNTEQNCYFEAMRETRDKSASVIERFRKALADNITHAKTAGQNGQSKNGAARTLELLKPEELEQNVAIAGIVSKCRAANKLPLHNVAYRLGWLIHKPLSERDNPLDPQQLCHALTAALQPLKLHIKARLVLFKQFDQQIIQSLPELIRQANQQLEALGYIPTPPAIVQADTQSKGHDKKPPARGFEGLSELLASLRALGVSVPSAPRLGHLNHGPALPSNELMDGITRLQSLYTHKQQSGAREIRAVVQHILSQRSRSGHPVSLAPMDEDVINLVALFFDFVLDDDALPTCIKLLISRLQLQTLKAALRDPGFFSNPDHPARHFIENLASAGMSCNDNEPDDPLLNTLKQSVQAILDSTDDCALAFEQQCEQISSIVHNEQRKSALIEKRTSEAAIGQARARHARQHVQDSLYQILRDRYLPESVLNFLSTTWRDVMFQVLLKFGEDSRQWDESIAVINELLHISTEARKSSSDDDIAASVNAVLTRITQLSGKAATPAAITSGTFRKLEETCQQWITGDGAKVAMIPLNSLHAEALGQSLANTIGSWDEEIAIEREEKKYASLSFDAIRLADSLAAGTWLYRINPLQLDQGQRCKLAAKIAETDTFIFVDANGFRLFELPRRSVAYELQRERMKVLDKGPLFERAFDSIGSHIETLTGEITSSH